MRKMHLRDLIRTLSPVSASRVDGWPVSITRQLGYWKPGFIASEHHMITDNHNSEFFAAEPHSADVERLINSSNSLKSTERSRMSLDTQKMYLYIHYNMPPVSIYSTLLAEYKYDASSSKRTFKGKGATVLQVQRCLSWGIIATRQTSSAWLTDDA